jgi:hypothetical protein
MPKDVLPIVVICSGALVWMTYNGTRTLVQSPDLHVMKPASDPTAGDKNPALGEKVVARRQRISRRGKDNVDVEFVSALSPLAYLKQAASGEVRE